LTRSFQLRGIALNDLALAVHDSIRIQKRPGLRISLILLF
jgi:hypothetical protein